MPILAASSGIVMPGWPATNESAWAERVTLPLRRPARRRGAAVVAAVAAAAVVAARGAAARRVVVLRVLEPRGRPGPRRAGAAAALTGAGPPTPASAFAAASSRLYSSISGFS